MPGMMPGMMMPGQVERFFASAMVCVEGMGMPGMLPGMANPMMMMMQNPAMMAMMMGGGGAKAAVWRSRAGAAALAGMTGMEDKPMKKVDTPAAQRVSHALPVCKP